METKKHLPKLCKSLDPENDIESEWELEVKLKKWRIVTKYRNVKYYRNHVTHTVSTKADLMQSLDQINHSGATWVPAIVKEPEPLEVLTFIAPASEIAKLKLPKTLGVMQIKQK